MSAKVKKRRIGPKVAPRPVDLGAEDLAIKVVHAMRDAMNVSLFEHLPPPAYEVGCIGHEEAVKALKSPNAWYWQAKIDKKNVVHSPGHNSRKDACLSAWRDFEDQLRQSLAPKDDRKVVRKRRSRR